MNVRVNLNYPIFDGDEIVFKAPCDASEVTGLIVYYPGDAGVVSSLFTFADAHTNDLGHIDELFAAGAVVKVILDTDTGMAFVQNAATNAYLENRFANMGGGSGGSGANTLIVTVLNGYASKTADEILNHVASGGNAVLYTDDRYINLMSVGDYSAVFMRMADDMTANYYELNGLGKVIQSEQIYVRDEHFTDAIGDISAALSELHAYAETLKGGEAV